MFVRVGVWEGEAADRTKPAKGVHGRAVGKLLLPIAGGVQGRPAEPWAGPVFTSILPRTAARQLCLRHQCCPPVQACPKPHHHQHRPHHPLGLSHAWAQLPCLAGSFREWAWREEWGRQRYGQPRRQRIHKVRPVHRKIQPDGNCGFLPGNDWEMYNWRAAKEGLY